MRKLSGLLLLLTAWPASAQERKLVVNPAGEPRPALEYRLLPPVGEWKSGNAAEFYYRALLPESWTHGRDKDIHTKMETWRKTPLKELQLKELAWLREYWPIEQSLEGARRRHCDFDLIARMRKSGAATLLPDIQSIRELNRLLVLRARLGLAEGKHDEAIRYLRGSFALSRHVGEAPTLINFLVGIACTNQALDVVEEWQQTPAGPNLYWSLTALEPWLDPRSAFEGERLMLAGVLPARKVLETTTLSVDEAKDLLRKLQLTANLLGQGGEVENGVAMAAGVVKAYPTAKNALLAGGFKEEELKAMQPIQVVVLHGLREHERMLDDRIKWLYLPYQQAHAGLGRIEESGKNGDLVQRFVYSLMPAISRVAEARAQLQRRIAALRIIEAVRMHAAAHDGQPPDKLADVKLVPIPDDPMTGKPFRYQRDGAKFTLEGPAIEGAKPNERLQLRYEVELKKK